MATDNLHVKSTHMVSTSLKGEITEAKVFAALLAADYLVVFPSSPTRRWDLGWEDGERLVRVQCKTGRVVNGAIQFNAASQNRHGRKSYRDQGIDYFGIFVPSIEKVYLVPITSVGVNRGCLRLDPPHNNQSKRILWAKDFELPLPHFR